MSVSKKLGKALQQVTEDLPVRKITIDLGEVKFDLRVRVPLKKQIEEINTRIINPPKEKADAIYEQLSGPMRQTMTEGGEDFVKALNENNKSIVMLDDDLIVDGTSVRQVAQLQAMEHQKVEEYFHLLVPEQGDAVDESYEQITEEFPEFVVTEIVNAIQAAISPDYKSVKKN